MAEPAELRRFLFEGLPVRGSLVRLGADWPALVALRQGRPTEPLDYPPAVVRVLGEVAAAAVLLQSNIQFQGALVLQLMGEGPVKLLVAEVQSDMGWRATAKVVGACPEWTTLTDLVGSVAHPARCAITLDPHHRQPGQVPHQSVVALVDSEGHALSSVAAVIEHHMLQSEQLDTLLVLAADDQQAAGLLLQRLPSMGQANLERAAVHRPEQDQIGHNEDYQRLAILARSLSRDELLTLDSDTLLRRLFWQEPLRPLPLPSGLDRPRFQCRCSAERVAGMLRSLGQAEVDSILAEQGQVEVDCDFCARQFRLDAVDAARLFSGLSQSLPGPRGLQ